MNQILGYSKAFQMLTPTNEGILGYGDKLYRECLHHKYVQIEALHEHPEKVRSNQVTHQDFNKT